MRNVAKYFTSQILRSIPIRYHHCSGMSGFFWFYQHHGGPKPLCCFILSGAWKTRQDLGQYSPFRGPNLDGLHLRYCETSKSICSLNLYLVQNLYIIIIGRVKRAPHWGVQSRFRVIYMYRISLITPRPCLVRALEETAHFAQASELYCAPSNRPRSTT